MTAARLAVETSEPPPPRSTMCRAAARRLQKAPSRFTLITRRHSAVDIWAKPPGAPPRPPRPGRAPAPPPRAAGPGPPLGPRLFLALVGPRGAEGGPRLRHRLG